MQKSALHTLSSLLALRVVTWVEVNHLAQQAAILYSKVLIVWSLTVTLTPCRMIYYSLLLRYGRGGGEGIFRHYGFASECAGVYYEARRLAKWACRNCNCWRCLAYFCWVMCAQPHALRAFEAPVHLFNISFLVCLLFCVLPPSYSFQFKTGGHCLFSLGSHSRQTIPFRHRHRTMTQRFLKVFISKSRRR